MNFRDLAGLRTPSGRAVRRCRLLRSGFLGDVSNPTAVGALATYRRLQILDLRTDREIERDGAPQSMIDAGATWTRLAIEDRPPDSGELTAAERFVTALPDCSVAAARAMQLAMDGPVLVTCSMGKDRTGLVVALILSSLGIRNADIVADFYKSNFVPLDAPAVVRNASRRGLSVPDYVASIRVPSGVIEDVLRHARGTRGEAQVAEHQWKRYREAILE